MRRDIDDALSGWPYDPEPGASLTRQIRTKDGRWVLQVRQELGVLQMESEGRPDGIRPHGFTTYLDYLRFQAERQSKAGPLEPDWLLTPEYTSSIDREFLQFYHRRMAWLSLHRYDRVLADAEHSLALMDFLCLHVENVDFIDAHERFRSVVLFHQTQAKVALALEEQEPEQAIDAIHAGKSQINGHIEAWQESHGGEDAPEIRTDALLEQLQQIEDEVRSRFHVGKTLQEQLTEAINNEDYEQAAIFRDRLRGDKHT